MPASLPVVVPSYLAKVHRAKKHLIDLKDEINRYAATKPYTVSERIEGKKEREVRRLTFTADPANTDIPIIAADVIYNLRSSLDHLMSSLVSCKDRGSAMFPVFFQGVWEPPLPGENEQRGRDRSRWTSYTKSVHPEALAFLKSAQPPDDAGDGEEAHLIRFLNRLSNRDRHEKLPVLVTGLRHLTVSWETPNGLRQTGLVPHSQTSFFEDEARLDLPYDAMNVEIEGSPLIVIRVRQDVHTRDRHLAVLPELNRTVNLLEEWVIPALSPYDRTVSR